MRFQHAALPLPLLWSSPFVRWQGSLADVPSLDLAAAVTGDALTARQFDRSAIGRIVLGMTIPQAHSFYGAPWLASRGDPLRSAAMPTGRCWREVRGGCLRWYGSSESPLEHLFGGRVIPPLVNVFPAESPFDGRAPGTLLGVS